MTRLVNLLAYGISRQDVNSIQHSLAVISLLVFYLKSVSQQKKSSKFQQLFGFLAASQG